MQFISEENKSKMNDLLKDDNIGLIMRTMIHEYVKKSVYVGQDLIRYINEIVTDIIVKNENDIADLKGASWMLLFQNEMNKQDVHSYFATMVPVMKTLYPDGLDNSANLAQKKYFKNFIDLCKNKKAFSWDNKSDVEWSDQYEYTNYLKMIFKNYIDNEDEKYEEI